MEPIDIAVLAILGGIILGAVVYIIKQKRKGGGCGCGCNGCPHANACHNAKSCQCEDKEDA